MGVISRRILIQPTKTNSNGCVGLGVIGVNEGGKVVIINVGGQRHEALKKNFDKFPQEQTDKQTDAHRCRNNGLTNLDPLFLFCQLNVCCLCSFPGVGQEEKVPFLGGEGAESTVHFLPQ